VFHVGWRSAEGVEVFVGSGGGENGVDLRIVARALSVNGGCLGCLCDGLDGNDASVCRGEREGIEL
jgi:hypothetical protein